MRVSGFVRFMAAPLVLLSLLGALFSASFFAYSNLTDETQIAELSFKQLGEDEYLVNLATGDFCDVRSFVVRGDQWRLDASFLKWKYWASALGLESQYRLDRLEGRFSDINAQNDELALHTNWANPRCSILLSWQMIWGGLVSLRMLPTAVLHFRRLMTLASTMSIRRRPAS